MATQFLRVRHYVSHPDVAGTKKTMTQRPNAMRKVCNASDYGKAKYFLKEVKNWNFAVVESCWIYFHSRRSARNISVRNEMFEEVCIKQFGSYQSI